MTDPKIIAVSDHAILRWLERVEGMDIVALRLQLATSAAVGLKYGAERVIVGSGKLVIEDGTVVTVLKRTHYRTVDLGRLEVTLPGDIIARRKPRRRRRDG
jgi:hypothetical protein